MSYAAVADVAALEDSALWDPAVGTPSSADVTGWLTTESTVLDGQIGHMVEVPVVLADSPNFYSVLAEIVIKRVYARVTTVRYGSDAAMRETARDLRKEADAMLAHILKGATGDGVALTSGRPESPGVPIGNFGTTPTTDLGHKLTLGGDV